MPDPSLDHIVEYYWRSVISLEESLSQQVPTPLMQGMTFNLNKLHEKMVFGSHTQDMEDYCYVFGQPAHHRISLSNPSGVDILGVKFADLGLYVLTGNNMQAFSDQIVSAEALWGKEIYWLCEALYEAGDTLHMIALLERFFYQKLCRNPKRKDSRGVLAALQGMQYQGIYHMDTLVHSTFHSHRTLERYFKEQIGMSPKKYARICRFNRAKSLLDSDLTLPWPELIHQMGYYDQSHFIKEFQKFSGKTPGLYVQEARETTPSLF